MLFLHTRRIPGVATLQSGLGIDLFAARCGCCLAPAASSAALRWATATSCSSPAAGPAAASSASSAADGAAAAPPAPQRLLRMSASTCACASQKLRVTKISTAGVQCIGCEQGELQSTRGWELRLLRGCLGAEEQASAGPCAAPCIDPSAGCCKWSAGCLPLPRRARMVAMLLVLPAVLAGAWQAAESTHAGSPQRCAPTLARRWSPATQLPSRRRQICGMDKELMRPSGRRKAVSPELSEMRLTTGAGNCMQALGVIPASQLQNPAYLGALPPRSRAAVLWMNAPEATMSAGIQRLDQRMRG